MDVQKKFREWTPDQYVTQTITPADVLPEDDLVFFRSPPTSGIIVA
jgi:hypothetical protein